jgi:ribA/ribD-fused uncharacterized protein
MKLICNTCEGDGIEIVGWDNDSYENIEQICKTCKGKGQMNVIKFYRVRDTYGFLSNFYKRTITLKGETWPSTEHYFQAQKFAGTRYESEIRKAKSPREAADAGRDRGKPLRADWEAVKDSVMYEAVKAKFTQHADLRQMLLDTGDATLVECTENDKYWGQTPLGVGENKLGKLLMKVREEIKG